MSESESDSRSISSLFEVDGGGGADGPTVGACGPQSSSEESFKSISSLFLEGRACFDGDAASSKSGVRLRFVDSEGNWGPIEDIVAESVVLVQGLRRIMCNDEMFVRCRTGSNF